MKPDDDHTCRPLLDDDGQVVASVHGQHPMSAEASAAPQKLVEVARRQLEADDPDGTLAARQEAAMERNRERLARIRGEKS